MTRRSWVQDPHTLKLIPKDEYRPRLEAGFFVMDDIKPYRSMATGEMVMGRRQHREHLRANRLIEIGNERQPKPEHRPDPTIRRDVIDAVQRHWR